MKKTLIALAAVAVSGAAFAQSTVTVYGLIDFGYETSKTTAGAKTTKVNSTAGKEAGRGAGNRIGFRGTEDLGGGLSASFQFESGLSAEGITPYNLTRQANLGVSGGFGTVRIGTFSNMFDSMTGAYVVAHTGKFVLTPGRSTNAVSYSSPSFNGLVVSVGTSNEKTSVNGAVAANAKTSGTQVSAAYTAGPLTVLAAHNDATNGAEVKAAGVTAAAGLKLKETAAKVTYNMGVAVPYIVIADSDVKGTIGNATGKLSVRGNEIGASFPMGAFSPFVAIANANYKLNGAKIGKYNGNSVGVDYALSKRTMAYAIVTSQKTKDAAGATTQKVSRTNIGIRHTF